MCDILNRKNETLYSTAIRYIGSILISDDSRVPFILNNCNILDKVHNILFTTNTRLLKESLWVLSNLAASGKLYSESMVNHKIIERIVNLGLNLNVDVQMESLWVITTIVSIIN